jgi:DNA-binding transcriptional regulator LsrR (DeoR family)
VGFVPTEIAGRQELDDIRQELRRTNARTRAHCRETCGIGSATEHAAHLTMKRVAIRVTFTKLTNEISGELGEWQNSKKLPDGTLSSVAGQIDNFDAGVKGADGKCIGSLEAMGAANPFDGAKSGDILEFRVGGMHFPGDDEPALRRSLGEASGQALMDLVTPGDVLGMSWSRTLSGLTAALTRMPPCPIVQLTGAVPPPDGRDLLDLVRSVARIGGGPAHVFYAPMIVDDAQTAAAIRRQTDVADAFALVPSVTMAMLAIGAWAPGLSTIYDACSPGERDAIAGLRVCAEMAGVFLAEDGHPVPTALDSRMIVTPGPALAQIPAVLAVAYGVAKGAAVHAAIRAGLIHGLVTHTSLARALLRPAQA